MTAEPAGDTPLARFARSMSIGYDEWHDGIGYDIDALRAASPAERAAIEAMVLPRVEEDWRDVEALAALDTPAARAALGRAVTSGAPQIRAAILRHAPQVVTEHERSHALVDGLRTSVVYGGLVQILREVAEFHPPAVVDALFDGALRREGEVAVHLAAMLFFVHGLSDEEFDMRHRPFFLRFASDDPAERATVFRELCARVGAPSRAV